MTTDVPLRWSVVVPVKVLAQAKSRLTGLAAADRAEMALAMAADTVAAAVAAAAAGIVLVITDDPAVGEQMAALGAKVLPDEPGGGLNQALAYGARYSRGLWPERGVAGLAGDLPALRSGELTSALDAAASHGHAFVPDADGTGTTLYAAVPGVGFEPRFGLESAARHEASGAVRLALPELAGLRRDVDTAEDLLLAASIGLGPRTRSLVSKAEAR
jgi:2-phospho-L-lactate guanylyltransferase